MVLFIGTSVTSGLIGGGPVEIFCSRRTWILALWPGRQLVEIAAGILLH